MNVKFYLLITLLIVALSGVVLSKATDSKIYTSAGIIDCSDQIDIICTSLPIYMNPMLTIPETIFLYKP